MLILLLHRSAADPALLFLVPQGPRPPGPAVCGRLLRRGGAVSEEAGGI